MCLEKGGGGVLEEGKGTNDLPEGKRICLRDWEEGETIQINHKMNFVQDSFHIFSQIF